MKDQEIYDITYEYAIKNREIFKMRKLLFTHTFATRLKDQKKMNAYLLNEFSSPKVAILEKYENIIFHEEKWPSSSRLLIKILLKYVIYLSQTCQLQKQEVREIIFGEKYQKLGITIMKSINKMKDYYLQGKAINFFHKQIQYNKDKTTEKQQKEEEYKGQIAKFSNEVIKKLCENIGKDSQFEKIYRSGVKKSMRALIPCAWEGRKFLMGKIFKQLHPIYELSLIQTKPTQRENSQFYIISSQYDDYKYQIEKKGIQAKSKIPKEEILNLSDLIFSLKYQFSEKKAALTSQLLSSFTKDIICQLILLYSLTKKQYPSLTPYNILYNTASQTFFLSLEPILFSALGYELADSMLFKKHMVQSDRIQEFHWFFTCDNEKPGGVQTFIANRAFFKFEFLEAYFHLMRLQNINKDNLKDTLAQFVHDFQTSQGIDLESCTFFNLNSIFKCNAKGIDMQYRDHSFSWLKFSICEYLKSLKILNKEYLYCLILLHALKLILQSPKNKYKKAALKVAKKISNMFQQNQQVENSNQIIKKVRKVGKKMADFQRYLNAIYRKKMQSPIEVTKIHLIDFFGLEKQLICLMPVKEDLDIQILCEILKSQKEEKLDQFFQIFKSAKKYRKKSVDSPQKQYLEEVLKLIRRQESTDKNI